MDALVENSRGSGDEREHENEESSRWGVGVRSRAKGHERKSADIGQVHPMKVVKKKYEHDAE